MTPTPKLTSGAAGADAAGQNALATAQLGPFVLNLCSSTTPMALPKAEQPELKRFSFFVSRRFEEGRERFRLHMGYFATLAEAEEWLGAVRDIYPGAWAGEAPGKKLRERAVAAAAAQAANASGPPPQPVLAPAVAHNPTSVPDLAKIPVARPASLAVPEINVPTLHAAAPPAVRVTPTVSAAAHPTGSAAKPAVSAAKPAISAAKPAVPGAKPAASGAHPAVPAAQPAALAAAASTAAKATAAALAGRRPEVRPALQSKAPAAIAPVKPAPRVTNATPSTASAGAPSNAVGAPRPAPIMRAPAKPASVAPSAARAVVAPVAQAPRSQEPNPAMRTRSTQPSNASARGTTPAASIKPALEPMRGPTSNSRPAHPADASRPANVRPANKPALPNSNVREVLAALSESPEDSTGETRLMPSPVMPSAVPADDAVFTDTQVLKFLETRRTEGTQVGSVEAETGAISLLKPDDTGTRRALKQAVVDNSPVSFAVQLQWSVQPIELAKVPPLAIFSAYTLYTVEGSRDGRRWYGLRLGFFTDAISAKQVAYYVRSEFTSVAVVPVSPQERTRASDADKKAAEQLSSPRKQRSTPVEEFKLIDSAEVPASAAVAAPQRAGAAGTAGASKSSSGKGAAKGSRVRARERRGPQTLEETLEILGASELEIDSGNGETLNESGVRHLRVEVQKNTPFSRLLERLSEKVRKA